VHWSAAQSIIGDISRFMVLHQALFLHGMQIFGVIGERCAVVSVKNMSVACGGGARRHSQTRMFPSFRSGISN
jgi:hypothetical protein